MSSTNISNSITTAGGWLKEVTGEVQDVRPDGVKLTRQVKFNAAKKLGDAYVEPVWLSEEQGFTYDAGTSGAGFDLNDSEAALSAQLRLTSAEMVLTSRVGLTQFMRAADEGKQSFGNFYRRLLANMASSFKKRVEITSIYGGTSIGKASSVSASTTTATITMNTAHYAPGIWAGSKNCKLDAYNGSTKLNTTGEIKVTAHTPGSAPTIAIEGAAADITAINSAGSSTEFYFKGAYGNEMTGIYTIAGQTTATYANISATTYDLWKGNAIPVGSADLTWDKIQDGVESAVGRGLDESIALYVPLPAWSALNSDLNGLRMLDNSYRKEKNEFGQESIVYHTLCGTVRIEPSIYVKYGDSFALPEEGAYCERIGSSDITFEIPGQGGEYFMVVPGKHQVEYRASSDQALLCRAPSKCIQWSGIVST
jgi:hypothetical protein